MTRGCTCAPDLEKERFDFKSLRNKTGTGFFFLLYFQPTFVLVSVQKVLKFRVEDLQMFLDEDLLTLACQLVLGGFVEVNLDAPLLLQQPSLSLQVGKEKTKQKTCLFQNKSLYVILHWSGELR